MKRHTWPTASSGDLFFFGHHHLFSDRWAALSGRSHRHRDKDSGTPLMTLLVRFLPDQGSGQPIWISTPAKIPLLASQKS